MVDDGSVGAVTGGPLSGVVDDGGAAAGDGAGRAVVVPTDTSGCVAVGDGSAPAQAQVTSAKRGTTNRRMRRRLGRRRAHLTPVPVGAPREWERTSPGAPNPTIGRAGSIVPVMTCESCGAQGEQLREVHRKYVTPAAWDVEPSEQVLTEIERWCFACLTHYPHEPA